MVRSVALIILLTLASGVALAAPRMSIGGGALSYTCTKSDIEPATCTCEGWFDCKAMVDDRVCRRGITTCGRDTKTGREVCVCSWRTSIMPKSGTVAPEMKMQSQ